MFLFSEEHEERPTVSKMLTKLADMNSVPPTTEGDGPPVKKGADLGTLTGVFLPCIQNIFGVILFIRMVWIVGTAGVPLAFIVVLICCLVTFATSISLSAIATNGIVPAGGSYFMISRALGPEFGGAVGILFFLATGVAGAMYITGAVEIVLNYMAPELALFGDFRADPNILYHNIRVYGTCLVVVCGTMVFIGVKFVSKVAPIALVCVILSILSIYSGIFINYEGTDASFCMLGDRIMASPVEHCTKNQSDPKSLYNVFCTPVGTNTNNNPNVPNININNGSLANFLINSHQRQQQHHVNPYQSSSSSLSYMSPDASISSYEATSSLLNSAIRYECDPFFMANEPTIKKAVPGMYHHHDLMSSLCLKLLISITTAIIIKMIIVQPNVHSLHPFLLYIFSCYPVILNPHDILSRNPFPPPLLVISSSFCRNLPFEREHVIHTGD